jgi:hypothetical protein
VRRAERANIVRLAVVVPGDNFNTSQAHGENLLPAVVLEKISGENPVLTVRNLGAKVREELRRHS